MPPPAESGAEQAGTADRGVPAARSTLVIASLAVLIASADTYVVVLALPDMMTGVGLGLDELQRAAPIVTAFLLGYVSAQPLIGRLADLRGCLPVLVGCLAIFAVGCLFLGWFALRLLRGGKRRQAAVAPAGLAETA